MPNGKYHIVLADFGLAVENNEKRLVSKAVEVGTLWFRAPELLCGVTTYNNKVDWYALGITFLALTNDTFINYANDLSDQQASTIQLEFGPHHFLFPFTAHILRLINPKMPPNVITAIMADLPPITQGLLNPSSTELIPTLCRTMAKDRWGDEEARQYLVKYTRPPRPQKPPQSLWKRLVEHMKTFL